MNTTRIATIRLKAVAAIAVVMMGAPFLRAEARVVAGEQRRWALDFRVRLEQPGGERPIEIDLSGDWVSTISAVRPGEYDAELQLANAQMTGDGLQSVPPDAQEQMRRRLSRPFWATYDHDGSLLTVHFYKDMNPSDRNLLQMIATETELVQAAPDRAAWTALERDGAGEYLAIYNRPNPNEVTKRKLKYVHAAGGPGVPADGFHLDMAQSELHFQLDPDGGIVALDGSDRVRMGVPFGNAGQLTATTHVRLTGLRRSQAAERIGSLARALPEVIGSPVVTQTPDPVELRARLDDQLLAGRTTQSLLKAATAKGEEPRLSERLAALFRRRPEATVAALDLLRKTGPNRMITDALGSAGSPAAIGALGSVALDGALPRALRIDALTGFVLMQHPSLQAMRIPPTLLDDGDARIASAARMASGALARAGRAEHRAEADQIEAALVERYLKAQDTGELSDLLGSLGNSIGASVLPVIEDALRDPRAPVRAAAARALRLATGPDIDGRLSAAITGDQDSGVRAAAIFAASFRHPLGPRLGEALVSAAKADPAESVRSSAVSLLHQNPEAAPDIREILAWVVQHDTKPGVRHLAQDALASLPR